MIVNKKFTIFPFTSPLQKNILDVLAQGAINGTDFLEKISLKNPTTKQGLYKALRSLLQEEIIIKERKFYSFNKVWLSRFNDFLEKSENNLGINLPFQNLSLNSKKTIIFKDAESLDIYWGNLYLTLKSKFKNSPFFFYNRHSWFIYSRPHSESYLYQSSLKGKSKIMITLGVNTKIAQKFKKDFAKNNIQIAIDEKFIIPITDHLCVIEDYLILTRYDKKTVALIDDLFNKASLLGDLEIKQLHKILSQCKKPKIIIAKNTSKANRWKRRLAKNFVIRKSEL